MPKILNYQEWIRLSESANGQLPDSELSKIPVISGDSSGHRLNPQAAAAYAEMVAAAKKDGVSWGITDSYRPLEVQQRLVKQKGLYSQGGLAAAPGTSNHGWGSAVDLKVKKGDAAHTWLVNNAAKFGFSTIPREAWHWEHKESAKVVKSGATPAANPTMAQTIAGNTRGEKIMNNKIITNWLFRTLPDIAPTITAASLEQTFNENPENYEWFKEKFGLDDKGNPVGAPDITTDSADTKTATNAALASKKIKSKYSGTAAQNIDLLISEMEAHGITNKYAIVGILSTIGKESAFIPKNEIPYNNTPNRRIRKIFGARVKDLTDDELTALKANTTKFWDRVYGSDDPTGKSQQYGNNQPGDGAKYLGRGFNGITFKKGYEKYGKTVGLDLVTNPDLLNDPKVAAKAAVAYFLNGLKAKGIDPNSFTSKADAIKTFVQLNAGAATNIEGSETLAKAEQVSNNFDIV